MMKERVLSRSIRMICVAGVAVSMHAAYADENAEPVQKVQVTGSRLSSPGAESPSPLQVLTAADIAASGAVNLQDLLQKNPTLGTPSLSRTNSNFLTSGGGVSTVNLRNLGDSRTLVLVNGRRFVAGQPGETAVDLNTIPVDFIERVELLTGGASATYGSDAVAGVVNIILKRNVDGLIIDTSTGKSSHSDDFKKKVALTWGLTSADGASNIMSHFGYSKQGAVMSKDRPGLGAAVDQISTGYAVTGDVADVFKATSPYYSSFAPQGRFFKSDGSSFTYDKNGNVIPWSTNGSATLAATGFNRSQYRTIAVPTERYLFATSGNYAINENHSAFFEGTYAQTKVDTNIEPYALDSKDIYKASGGKIPAEFNVNGAMVRNPLVPDNLWSGLKDTDGDGARDWNFTRRMAEVGNRHSTVDRGTFRLATGLKGTILNDWNYDTYLVYGRTTESQTSTGQVNVLNFRNALEAIPDGKGGVMCRDANARAQGCVPINVFGYNSITPDALKYVVAPGSLATEVTQKLAGASLSGELPWGLPAGKIGLAAGFEWRNEASQSVADPLTQAGLNAGNAIPPTYGSFTVREEFVEGRVPLLKDKLFAKQLDLRASFRHGDYSTVGSTNSWNAGFEWSPVSDVKFRGTHAVSTRAPNINELYQPPSQTFPSGLIDPCQGVTATGTDAKSVACRAAPGVAANIAANGGVFKLNQSDIQGISGYNRGNANLGAEKGRSNTVGVVVTPRSIPMLSKFTFTADYFNIKIADAIVGTPRQFALQQCYAGDAKFCQFITRRATAEGSNSAGSIKYIDSADTNSGGKGTEGIDLTASWSDKVGPGRLSSQFSYTYLKTLWDIPLPGADKDESAGEVEAPRNKFVLNLAYKWGAFGISSTTTYTGRVGLDDQFLKANFDNPQDAAKIGSVTYQDFQFTYDVKKMVQLYLGVNNAFDKKAPPIISGLPGNSTGTETDASAYDPIGRRYYLGVRVSL